MGDVLVPRAPGPHAQHFVPTARPWLGLYGRFLRFGQQLPEEVELAPVQLLPDELILLVLSKLPAYSLGSFACVCHHWRALAEHPRLWERACQEALGLSYPCKTALQKAVVAHYRGSWRRMFLEHPHLRFDGVYVSRNTYVRTGVAEWTSRSSRPVYLVAYYRYYRFFPDGTLLYRTSPHTISRVAKSLYGSHHNYCHQGQLQPHLTAKAAEEHVYPGRYVIRGAKVWVIVTYPNSRSTEIRSRLTLRSTHPGTNNRLDIESIFSFDRDLGTSSSLAPGAASGSPDQEPADNEGQRREHKRGLTTCVFVPWDAVHTSVLNTPAQQMDIFIPG